MKYRPLTKEELLPLEQDFIDFLVVNGVVADDWQSIQENEKEKANGIIDAFSDVVFESIMRKTQFLDMVLEKELFAFQCLSDKMVLAHLKVDASELDFRKQEIGKVIEPYVDDTRISIQEKPYQNNREEELFQMTEKGCEISDGTLFKQLSLLYASQKVGG